MTVILIMLLHILKNNGGEKGSTGVKKLKMRFVEVLLHVKPRRLNTNADDYVYAQAA